MRAVMDGLRRAYSRLGHEAFVVSPPAPAGRRLAFAPLRGVRRVRSARELGRLLAQTGADVAHLQFSGWMRPWLLPLARRALPCPLIVSFQDFEHPDLPETSREELKALLRRARAATAVSEFLKKKIAARLSAEGKKIVVVRNGVSVEKKRGGTRGDYVLSVGRLAPYKGTDVLLMAFAGLPPGVELVLCGAPFHEKHTRGLIDALRLRSRVRLTGLVSPARVRALLSGCLVYASAARSETFGLALMEAMAAGKPVVAARAGAVPEYLRHGRDGLLVPAGDVGAMTRGLEKLLASSSLRVRLGRAAAKTARRFSWDAAARGYLAVYR